jgi:hypothetical protein
MGPPEYSAYEVTLRRVRDLASADRARKDLRRYLDSFAGAKYDHLADRLDPNELTRQDFLAARKLNVSVLLSWATIMS